MPATVLADAAPLERHRPRDLNIEDHFMRITCVRGAAMIAADKRAASSRAAPTAACRAPTLDVPRALALGDAHAQGARLAPLARRPHLGDKARARFAAAIDECPEK